MQFFKPFRNAFCFAANGYVPVAACIPCIYCRSNKATIFRKITFVIVYPVNLQPFCISVSHCPLVKRLEGKPFGAGRGRSAGRDGFRKDRSFAEEASPVVPAEFNAAESFVAEPVVKPTRAPKPAAGEGDKAARKAKVQKAIRLSKSKGGAKAAGKAASKASSKAAKAVKPAKPSAKPVKRAAKSGSKAKKA